MIGRICFIPPCTAVSMVDSSFLLEKQGLLKNQLVSNSIDMSNNSVDMACVIIFLVGKCWPFKSVFQ